MVRISPVGSALLIAASALTLSNAAVLQYDIRVRNLTFQQPFAPVLFFAHTKELNIFKEGLPASDALKTLAEDEDASAFEALVDDPSVASYVCGHVVGSGRQMPGTTERYTFLVDDYRCGTDAVLSMATMVVNTNDGFVGFDSIDLKASGTSTLFPPVWDAGTEDNNELCTHIPGPACSSTDGNEEDGPGEGYVHIHRGIHCVGGLSEADHSWLNPAAEVFIAKPSEI